jgi:hypothetical protein
MRAFVKCWQVAGIVPVLALAAMESLPLSGFITIP